MENTEQSNIFFLQMAKTTTPTFTENKNNDWVSWGENNHLPDELIKYSNGYCPAHTAILNRKINLVAGNNIQMFEGDKEKNQILNIDTELIKYLSADLEIVGASAIEIILSQNSKNIAELNHIPIQYLRFKKINEMGKSEGMYYSRDFGSKKVSPIYIPFYSPSSTEKRQILLIKKYWAGSPYTIIPSYFSALNYIKISERISNFHNSNLNNGMNPGLIVSFNDGEKDPNIQKKIVEGLEKKFLDTENTGKFMVIFNKGKDSSINVTQLDGNKMDKLFTVLNEQVLQEIITAHELTNPLLAGIKVPSSLGGSQELLQSYELFYNNTIQPDQNLIENGINKVLLKNNQSIKITNNQIIKYGFSEAFIEKIMTIEERRKLIGLEGGLETQQIAE